MVAVAVGQYCDLDDGPKEIGLTWAEIAGRSCDAMEQVVALREPASRRKLNPMSRCIDREFEHFFQDSI